VRPQRFNVILAAFAAITVLSVTIIYDAVPM